MVAQQAKLFQMGLKNAPARWTLADAVTLNPERDSIVSMAVQETKKEAKVA